MDVRVLPLVPDALLPHRAPGALRAEVPPGYGVQEHCLPFMVANGLGLLVPAPFDFGLCAAAELPPGVRAFQPPEPARQPGDARLFYVRDRPGSRFEANAFSHDPLPFLDPRGACVDMRSRAPGLSFFERADQADLFKLHLPWVLRTPKQVDALFGPPINRAATVDVLSGLVESDWYAHPVNLVLRRSTGALHVRAGDVVAQVHFVGREARRPGLRVLATGSTEATALRNDLLQWYVAHGRDRSAYRHLAREQRSEA